MGGHTPEVERFLLCVCVPVELLLNKIKNLTVERLIKLKGMHVRGRERERWDDRMRALSPAWNGKSQEITRHPSAGILPLKLHFEHDTGWKALMTKPASQLSNNQFRDETANSAVSSSSTGPVRAGSARASHPHQAGGLCSLLPLPNPRCYPRRN